MKGIKVGGIYRTRAGNQATCVADMVTGEFPLLFTVSILGGIVATTCCRNGSYYVDQKHDHDIIGTFNSQPDTVIGVLR